MKQKKTKGPAHPQPGKLIPRSQKVNINWTGSPSKSIPIKKPFPLPPYARSAIHKLHLEGYLVYVVGGCVRDFLMGNAVKDVDLATDADPEILCVLFPNAVTVGKAFGVIKIPTGTIPPLLEIATFREDMEYEDFRRPKGVVYSNPMEDALRRDFTLNSLFYDPISHKILDFTGQGFDDLDHKILRAIGEPMQRFKEDALRLLRAVRFKTRFDLNVELSTKKAIEACAQLISKVSIERVRDELTLMLRGPHPDEAFRLLAEYGLLAHVLPEIESLRIGPQKVVWKHILRMLQYMAEHNPTRSVPLVWAVVLHDLEGSGYGAKAAEVGKKVSMRLKMSRAEVDRIATLVENRLKFKEVFQMREATLQRFIRQEGFEELLTFHKAEAMALDGNLAFYEYCAYRYAEYLKQKELEPPKWVTGDDLIQLGFFPGPEFSKILRTVEDLTFEGILHSKEEALEYVVKTFVK